jgi:RimJ/RimL family protein N-acetyltransferase
MTMPALTYPSLSDGVITLRPWKAEDVDAQLAAFTDPVFLQFSDWAPSGRVDVAKRIAAIDQACEQGIALHLAIAAAGQFDAALGEVSLSGVDLGQRRASVGYWLMPGARGRGVASGAVRLIVGWAFSELRLARLELTCGPDNVASQRVARRCGFRQEGLLRSHLAFKGGRRDSLVFGLLPGELIQ